MNRCDLMALGEFMGLKLDRELTNKVILPLVEEAFTKAVSGPAPKSMAGADGTLLRRIARRRTTGIAITTRSTTPTTSPWGLKTTRSS